MQDDSFQFSLSPLCVGEHGMARNEKKKRIFAIYDLRRYSEFTGTVPPGGLKKKITQK